MLTIKQLKIAELPEGYFKGQLERLVQDPTNTKVYVVVKKGHNNDWAAYIGFPTLGELLPQFQSSSNYEYYCTRVHEPNDVADRGDKLSATEAKQIFPDITLRYRE